MFGIFRDIQHDARAAVFNRIDLRLGRMRQHLSTAYMRLVFRARGVTFGQGCTFFGRMMIRRLYKTEIRIGSRCVFRSAFSSNFAGLNRRCLIATLREGARIVVGDGVGMSGTVIGAAESVTIGNGVLCGANTLITDTDWHAIDPAHRHGGEARTRPVVIGDNVWLGLNTIVLKGTRIGKNTIITANSVVSGKVPAGVIAGGNPCQVLMSLGTEEVTTDQREKAD